jgi:hypothetical protein
MTALGGRIDLKKLSRKPAEPLWSDQPLASSAALEAVGDARS